MTDSHGKKSGSGRKTGILVGVVVLLIVALSGGWYWAADKLDETVRAVSARLSDSGKRLDCNEQDVAGYPFRIGLRCASLIYEDPQAGISVTGGALRSAAQLYRPGHVVAELDSPVDLSLPGLAPLTLDWENLQSSSRINTSGPQRASLVIRDLDVSANDFGTRDLLAEISELQLHARASETDPGDLDVALSADEWLIDDNGFGGIKPFRLNFIASLKQGHSLLLSGTDLQAYLMANGGEGTVQELTLGTLDGGVLSLSGPLSIDRQGRLSGDITIDMEEPAKLVAQISTVFPPAGPMLENTAGFLQGFAKQENGKAVIRDLPLAIEKGKVFAGFFEVGEIPPLFR